MVSALAGRVESAGATFFADPFEPAPPDEPAGLIGMLKTLARSRLALDPADGGELQGTAF